MTRHECARTTAALVTLLPVVVAGQVLAAPSSTSRTVAAEVEAPRPNILNIVLDDWRDDGLDAMAASMPKTMAWMAAARSYENTDVAISSCCPSRAVGFSGRYSHNNGVDHQADGPQLSADTTLQRHLRVAGYQTFMSGKYLHGFSTSYRPPHWTRSTSWLSANYNDFYANVDGRVVHVQQYATTYTVDRALAYLREFAADPAPFYGYVALHAPHVQKDTGLAVPEPKYANAAVRDCVQPGEADRRDKPGFVKNVAARSATFIRALCQSQLRALMSVDDQIDRVMAYLSDSGQLSTTAVVLWSDNGFQWGEHGLVSKFVPYLPSVNVPLFVRWPGRVPPGRDSRLVSTVDLAPTILDIAGVPEPARPETDGESLLGPSSRSSLYNEYFYDSANRGVWTYAQIHDQHYSYTRYYDQVTGAVKFTEYYDLDADPRQLTNLLQDGVPGNEPSAAVLAGLGRRLEAARSCSGSGCLLTTPVGPP